MLLSLLEEPVSHKYTYTLTLISYFKKSRKKLFDKGYNKHKVTHNPQKTLYDPLEGCNPQDGKHGATGLQLNCGFKMKRKKKRILITIKRSVLMVLNVGQ